MGVIVEKSEEFILEFREFLFTRKAQIIFHIVVQQMNGFWLKKFIQFRILMDYITKMNFIDIWISSLVSNSSPEEHHRKYCKSFKSKSKIPKLIEKQREGRKCKNLEWVLISFTSVVDSFEGWEYSIQNILKICVEWWVCDWRIFRLANFSGFKTIFQVSIVSRLPFVLPPNVIGISSCPAYFIVTYSIQQ